MANSTSLHGLCPPPFLEESLFLDAGGYLPGRFCSSIPGVADGHSCCLPCPITDWIYPDNFYSTTRIAGYIDCVALALCVFMLISQAVLPPKERRHYLNINLIIAAIPFHLGFVIPWAARPAQCYDAITPNGDTSSYACAWGGALIVFGGVALNMWILIRALSMHLQICWNITTGERFVWVSVVLGWLVSGILLTTQMTLTGVSMRFGDYCHVNHHESLATLWGPLLAMAGVCVLLQLSTFAYCLQVYLRNIGIKTPVETEISLGGVSSRTFASQSTRAVFVRVRKVISLQWRGLAIAVILVIDVVYFSVIFVVLDSQQEQAFRQQNKFLPWATCLIFKGKNECLDLTEGLSIAPSILIATLILLSLVGIEVFALLFRVEMVTGWWNIIRDSTRRRQQQQDFYPLENIRSSESVAVASPPPPPPLSPGKQYKSPYVTELARVERV